LFEETSMLPPDTSNSLINGLWPGLPLLDRLRKETAAVHARVEAVLDLLSPALDIGRYCRIVQAMQAAWVPLEAALRQHCPPQYSELWRDRERAHRLEEDLAFLGRLQDAQFTGAATVPHLAESSVWLGALYVTEGSTLGGQVISRYLERRFGWSQGRGYSFFLGYGPRTGERWRQVMEVLESPGLNGNQVIRGAHQIFSYLELCFAATL
jgi:heme oxygenase